ncbi:MAG: molybdopterin biosynthesis protein MoeB [Planctomycetaceae bacterium]|nr:MAG: molybdopterin biosynthesis protein MoeB [Planctomycetaceae bacterium]
MTSSAYPPEWERYSRQMRYALLGVEGQRALARSRVLICGCGALGSALAEGLARAGVGFLRLIDRDYLELSNLQRQALFDEQQVRDLKPKAIAAAERLKQINSTVVVEPIVADVHAGNILSWLTDIDLILDGTDNFETRFLLNDAALEVGRPWIYAGVVGAHGQMMVIKPPDTPCLRCVLEEPPPPGSTETCDTAGILGPAVQAITALQAIAALKLLTRQECPRPPNLLMLDIWQSDLRKIDLSSLLDHPCPACRLGERRWLKGQCMSTSAVLCGRQAVQITPPAGQSFSWDQLKHRWQELTTVVETPYLLRSTLEGYELTLFRDGRAIIRGTTDPVVARSVYAKFIGG